MISGLLGSTAERVSLCPSANCTPERVSLCTGVPVSGQCPRWDEKLHPGGLVPVQGSSPAPGVACGVSGDLRSRFAHTRPWGQPCRVPPAPLRARSASRVCSQCPERSSPLLQLQSIGSTCAEAATSIRSVGSWKMVAVSRPVTVLW